MSWSFPAQADAALQPGVDFTRQFIRSKNPCAEGFRWYLRHHHHGSSYQHVLDTLVEAGRVEDACWLLDQLGPTNALLQVDFLSAEAVVFAGTIEARRGIDVGTVLRAGRSIRSGGSVSAGCAIVAGDEVRSRGAIRSGGRMHARGDVHAEWGIEIALHLHCEGLLKSAGVVSAGHGFRALGDVSLRDDLVVQGDLSCAKALRATGRVAATGDIRVAQGIECGLGLEAGRHVEAGLGIRAGGPVQAGGAIRAGESICAQGELRSGTGYGIYAGLGVPMDAWETSARVSAALRPPNLMSGLWCPAGEG
ncbi:MAG: hypothetical protein EOO30_15085 [Comamonadaceae bacterium]|nr:MAG: hypothetical protein EOO30_15085 [Comamonadaceae bacterium]